MAFEQRSDLFGRTEVDIERRTARRLGRGGGISRSVRSCRSCRLRGRGGKVQHDAGAKRAQELADHVLSGGVAAVAMSLCPVPQKSVLSVATAATMQAAR